MCLPNFIEFKIISEAEAIIGYRNWRIKISGNDDLVSESQNYIWPVELISHKVEKENSGIYSYNNYNYYYNNYNNYYNNNNYYNIGGTIKQFGKVAIHKIGYRSEFARIDILFTIRELDAIGDEEFKNWIKVFNERIIKIANKYGAKTIHYQDFIEDKK